MSKKIYLAPSLLSANFLRLEKELEDIEKAGCKYLHLDVMDGQYVPNISFGMPVIKSLKKSCSNLIFDVHLMVEEPGRFIDDFVQAGADIITVHVEACKHLDRTLSQIRDAGVKVGVTLNPATSLDTINYVLDKVDQVLIMSVNPGFGNQSFINYSLDKIRELKNMIDKRNLNIDIEVDGGIKLNNIDEVLDAGANIIVAGSAVFGENTFENAKNFNEYILRYENR